MRSDLDANGLYCMDAMEALSKIPDNSVQLFLTDIPYDVVNRESNGLRSFDKGDADIFSLNMRSLISEFIRVTKGSIYVFCGTEQVSDIRAEMVKQKLSTRLCIWEKTNPSPVNGEHLWLSGVETCVFGRKKKAVFNEHCKNSVWRYPIERNQVHPTQKPLELFRYLIKVSSNENDLVMDLFIGSGTTALACQQLNRKYIGVDKSEEYITLARKRLSQKSLHQIIS